MTLDEAWERGVKAQTSQDWTVAEECFRYMLGNGGTSEVGPYQKLAEVMMAVKRWPEAVGYLEMAVGVEARSSTLLYQLGAAYAAVGRQADSRTVTDRALEISPDMPGARWNRALSMLQMGEWVEGWKEYAWGRVAGSRPTRHVQPEWDGDPFDGTLYVWAEQGLGDTIMALRWLKYIQRYATRIVLEVQPALFPLLQNFDPGYLRVVCSQSDNGFACAFDEHISLMSLPWAVLIGPAVKWDKAPYLSVPPVKLPADTLNVGFCWKGNSAHPNDSHRSLTDEQARAFICEFSPEVGGRPISLVPNGGTLDVAVLTPDLPDILRTAQIIAALDLVITVDTMVAHLAGALGIPCWLLLSVDPDWRWGLGSDTTPLYNSMKLYRQETYRDWLKPMERIISDLADFARNRPRKEAVSA